MVGGASDSVLDLVLYCRQDDAQREQRLTQRDDIADSPPAGTTDDAPAAEGPQVEDRDALREAQDEEYRRALAADEAQQRLQEPVDHEAVRAARLRHWLQSS